MRRILACVIGVMLLLSGCSSGGGDEQSPKSEDVKASVDGLATKLLPALAKAFGGEFPLAQGKFVGCDAGRDVKRYVASGELHSGVADNAKAARKIRATLSDSGVSARIGRDSSVKGKAGDLVIMVEPNVVSPNSVEAIRPVTIVSECQRFSAAEVVKLRKIRPKVYGEPVTGTH